MFYNRYIDFGRSLFSGTFYKTENLLFSAFEFQPYLRKPKFHFNGTKEGMLHQIQTLTVQGFYSTVIFWLVVAKSLFYQNRSLIVSYHFIKELKDKENFFSLSLSFGVQFSVLSFQQSNSQPNPIL
jgi:hypothetical protein